MNNKIVMITDRNMEQAPGVIIRTERLGKQLSGPAGTLTILNDINLTINHGETVAVTGVSGSGKSTLLGILAGLDLPSRGKVFLDHAELTALDEAGRAAVRNRRVGFVFQSFQLLPGLSALENVMLPLELAGNAAARELALAGLDEVGLAHRTAHYPKQLSGGEQQRVAIARAFAGNPRVLFADEVTGNLDRQTATQVAELLFCLNSARGTTLLLVTHDATLAHRCGRVLTLADGRLL